MSFSEYLRHLASTKGPLHALERTTEVIWRFARGRHRFRERLAEFEEFFTRRGFRLTFCITASLLKRHGDLFRALAAQGHEIAAHGYDHTRLDQYDFARQRTQIEASYHALREAGFTVSGFRAPYLNFNEDTIQALRLSSFRWTSGEILWWEDGRPSTREAMRLRALYHFRDEPEGGLFPVDDGELVHLPITAPDDELLFERWRIRRSDELARIWLAAFRRHHEQGGFHHQFFHPERFPLIRPALDRLLEEVAALGPAVWRPTLGELAAWWREQALLQSSERIANSCNLATSRLEDPAGSGSSCAGDRHRLGTGSSKPEASDSAPQTSNLKPCAPVRWPDGARSCFVLSADICAVDLWDFVARSLRF